MAETEEANAALIPPMPDCSKGHLQELAVKSKFSGRVRGKSGAADYEWVPFLRAREGYLNLTAGGSRAPSLGKRFFNSFEIRRRQLYGSTPVRLCVGGRCLGKYRLVERLVLLHH